MIIEKDGRARSERTADEINDLLKKELEGLTKEEREVLEIMLRELEGPNSEKPRLFSSLGRTEWKRTPVDMRTFIQDDYYLGRTCDNTYPKWVDDLEELFSGDYTECILTGAIGTGKTQAATIGICRILYELSCMVNPHKSFGLQHDSNISIVALSVSEALAVKVVFENISTKIKASPYFQEHFKFDDTKKELRFPGNVWVAARASSDTSALGLNAIASILDETNFLPKSVAQTTGGQPWGHYDRAETLYNTIKRRMVSRFQRHGKLPGMLFIVSSKRTTDDFTARRIRESKGDPKIFVRDYSLWGIKPEDYYSSEKFPVVCGNEQLPSRIVTPEEADAFRAALPEGVTVIDVPEDFRGDFERDLEGSIRDLAGISTVSINPFIQRREKIRDAIQKNRKHPFSHLVYDRGVGGQFIWPEMVQDFKEREFGIDVVRKRPIINPRALRHVHIDPSMKRDSSGFCMAHVGGWKDVERRSEDGSLYVERAPVYIVDVLLKVVPPVGGEIVFADLRRMIYELSDHGYTITSISLDQFQSGDMIQQLSQRGYNAHLQSVDVTPDPYENLKTALYEDRVFYYDYAPLIAELQTLEDNRSARKRKIDHPVRGCFTGDTRIALLDGTLPTFEELAKRFPNGEKFPVYSMSPDGICGGWGRNPRITKRTTDLVEVVLDNYQVIQCTPDHLFMTLDQEWIQARNLTPDVRLMPLYRSRANKGGWSGYERVWCPGRKDRVLTHQLLARQFLGDPSGKHVHHKDEVKHNNHPDNLEVISKKEHLREHTARRHATDPDYVSSLRAGHEHYRHNGGNEKSRSNILRLFEEGKLKRGREPCAIEGCVGLSNARGLCGAHYQKMRRDLQRGERAGSQRNHRILSVRKIEKEADVWDITVDDLENFALASGIFVHNSKDVADALAGSLWTLSETRLSQPLPIMKGTSYRPEDEVWMPEQAAAAGAGNPGAGEHMTLPMPFMGGRSWGGGGTGRY